MTEQQPYEVLKKYAQFELRHYPAHLEAQVLVSGDFISAGNYGFGPLVRFISGNNVANQKLAMTAPVIQQTQPTGKHLVSFVLPAGTDLAAVSKPTDASVAVLEVPPFNAVALGFSGRWDTERFDQQEQLLRRLAGQAIIDGQLAGVLDTAASFARFDPPFKPWFLRRNEVVIRVF